MKKLIEMLKKFGKFIKRLTRKERAAFFLGIVLGIYFWVTLDVKKFTEIDYEIRWGIGLLGIVLSFLTFFISRRKFLASAGVITCYYLGFIATAIPYLSLAAVWYICYGFYLFVVFIAMLILN